MAAGAAVFLCTVRCLHHLISLSPGYYWYLSQSQHASQLRGALLWLSPAVGILSKSCLATCHRRTALAQAEDLAGSPAAVKCSPLTIPALNVLSVAPQHSQL